jgi:hypothetical protein
MQRNVQISENVFIKDLGTGYSYVNFYRSVVVPDNAPEEEEVVEYYAQEQYRVKNPANYPAIVNAVVQENYPHGADQAALRKGIANPEDADFVSFNAFVEQVKQECKNEGIC